MLSSEEGMHRRWHRYDKLGARTARRLKRERIAAVVAGMRAIAHRRWLSYSPIGRSIVQQQKAAAAEAAAAALKLRAEVNAENRAVSERRKALGLPYYDFDKNCFRHGDVKPFAIPGA